MTGGTPGIKYNKVIYINPNEELILTITGYKSNSLFTVHPYILDNKTKNVIYGKYKTEYLTYDNFRDLQTDKMDIKLKFNFPSNITSIILYILFHIPNINDTFTIHNIDFSYNSSNFNNVKSNTDNSNSDTNNSSNSDNKPSSQNT